MSPMPGDKQGRDNDHGETAEHTELSGTRDRPGAHMGIPARFQPGQALEMVARSRKEEVVDGVGNGKRQGAPMTVPTAHCARCRASWLMSVLSCFLLMLNPGVRTMSPRFIARAPAGLLAWTAT